MPTNCGGTGRPPGQLHAPEKLQRGLHPCTAPKVGTSAPVDRSRAVTCIDLVKSYSSLARTGRSPKHACELMAILATGTSPLAREPASLSVALRCCLSCRGAARQS